MIGGFLSQRTKFDVPVTLDIEQTAESLHAYAIPEGVDIREGDTVQLHGAPSTVGYGEIVTMCCQATVVRAPWWERRLTRAMSIFNLTELYEVGFGPLNGTVPGEGSKP
jgi:hypothetical protein